MIIKTTATGTIQESGVGAKEVRKHSHYFKKCPYDEIDVYRVLELFNVTNPPIQHAVKKLLVAGGRAGGKDITKDVQEAIISLERWLEMRKEDEEAKLKVPKEPFERIDQ